MGRSKKEIDKELMYKKLMPSAKKTIKSVQHEDTLEDSSTTETGISIKEEKPVNFRRAKMRREVGIPTMDTQQTVIINAMESAVIEKLDNALNRFKCCRCDRCKKDIIAFALNRLEPKYMVIYKGQTIPDLDQHTNSQVVAAVIKGVLAVRAHPRH